MAVISGGVSLNGNASLSGSIQLNSANNRSSSTIDGQQAQSIIILPSSNSYRQNSVNPANTNYDSWNHSHQQPNYNNYTNANYTNNQVTETKEQKLWNALLAIADTLSKTASNKTDTPQSNENLSYVAKTLADTLKTTGSLSSNGLQNQASPYFDYNNHHSNHATNGGLTSSREHNYTNPNSSYHHSNYSGNGGLTSAGDYNYTNANSTNNISVYQAPDGSFIISLPPDTTSSNYNTTNASHSYRYSPDYSNLNNNNPNINWPPNLQHNSTIRLSI